MRENDPDGLFAFLQTLSLIELIAMQHEARRLDDPETLRAVLVELGRRPMPTPPGGTR